MTTKKQVPYIKPSLKPIRPKPQILCDSNERHSLTLVPSSVPVKSSIGQINLSQNFSQHVQKREILFNCYGKNKSICKCQKMSDTAKHGNYTGIKDGFSSNHCANNFTSYGNDLGEVAFVPCSRKMDIPNRINIFSVVTPHIINLGNKTDINLKEGKYNKNKSTVIDSITSNCTKQQLHPEAQSRNAINECTDKCNNSSKHNSNIFLKKLSSFEGKKKINLSEKNLRQALIKTKPNHKKEFINNELNVMLTENFENSSEDTLKSRESAILKTFAKIAPCSPASTNKARNFFTIKRNGKKSLVVCRNVKERQLQFLPADYCNSDRCCPNLLKEFGTHKHSILNMLEEVIRKKSKNSEDKTSVFVNSINNNNICNSGIDNHIISTQRTLNSDLEIINQVEETNQKSKSEIISADIKPKINHADKKRIAKQLFHISENEIKFDNGSNVLNGKIGLKCKIPADILDSGLDQSRRKGSENETTLDISVDKPIIKETIDNANNCSSLKVIADTDEKIKSNLDVPVSNTKSDLWSNPIASSFQIKEILRKYPRIAPRLNYVQDKSQINIDMRNKKKSTIYQTSKYHETTDSGNNSLLVYKRIINGDIKNKQGALPFGSGKKNDLKNIDHEQEKNTKKFKISSDVYSKKTQCEKIIQSSGIKSFLHSSALACGNIDSKQEESGNCCSLSQNIAGVNVTVQCNAENNCSSEIISCCIPKVDEICCLPVHCSSLTDNIDLKLLSFTELTDLSQKMGEEIFHFLSLDEITEKAILEWTETSISSTDSSSFRKDSNQTNTERFTSNCCSIFHNSHLKNVGNNPCYLNICETTASFQQQQQQLKATNGRTINFGSSKLHAKKVTQFAIESEVVCNNSHSGENSPSINDVGKTEFLNHLDLHRSDNVFGISVLFPRASEELEPDYVKNPCVPLHHVIKTFKSLRQNCIKSRNCNKTEQLLTASVTTSLSTDFCNEKSLLSMHKMDEVEPVLKNAKGKCLVIPSGSRHKGACLLIPVQTMFTSTGNSITDVKTSKHLSAVVFSNNSFTTQCKPSVAYDRNSSKFLPLEKKSSILMKEKINQFSNSSLPKSVLAQCQIFSPVTSAKHTNIAHSLYAERTAKRSSTSPQSQKAAAGGLKIPKFSVIPHCCTSSHHSNFCCDINNRYHRLTKLC